MPRAESIRAVPFPGGIADSGGRFAALRAGGGRVVAVALQDGAVLWRSAEALVPLLLTPDELIALRLGASPACVAIALRGPDAGRETWASEPVPIAAWLAGAAETAGLAVTAEAGNGTIHLRWRARARYRGGAAPGPRVLEQSARDEHAAVAVDRTTGSVRSLPPPPDHAGFPEAGPAPDSPDALARIDIGSRRYELALEAVAGGTIQTVLRASDAADGTLLWRTVIDEAPRQPPRALRL